MSHDYDVIVVGAGMVGAAIGYGLAGTDRRVLMLDGADTDYRAAKVNFGLVWVQGKGFGHPEYQRLSLEAVHAWPEFAAQLEAESDMALAYERNGGLTFCLSDEEWSVRAERLDAWHAEVPEVAPSTHMLERSELMRRIPTMKLGKDVVGASFGDFDGQVNPLRLLAALQKAYLRRGGQLLTNHAVTSIETLPGGGFEAVAGNYRARAERIVVASGLGSSKLGPMVGLDVPLQPQRGQIMVTERLETLFPIPASGLRQTAEGTVMIGVTQEDVGYNVATTSEGAVRMLRRTLRIVPDLARAKLVRQWAGLRVMTPDGLPVYARSVSHPGAEIATCHSAVTLASIHAGLYARTLADRELPASLDIFHHRRFDVSKNR